MQCAHVNAYKPYHTAPRRTSVNMLIRGIDHFCYSDAIGIRTLWIISFAKVQKRIFSLPAVVDVALYVANCDGKNNGPSLPHYLLHTFIIIDLSSSC